jgi:hypothetical protein
MKYFFRSFLFLLFLVLFNLKSFALEISEIDSTTGHNWFKILNNLADISNFASGDYRVYENGKSHLISTVNLAQDKDLHINESAYIVNSTSSFFDFNSGYTGILFDSSFDLPNDNGYVAITDKDNTIFFACKSYGSGVCPNTSINSTTSTTTINPPASTTVITNTVYIYVPTNNQNKYGDINVLLPDSRIVPAGAEAEYTLKATDSHGSPLLGLDFNWSFGDGGEKFGKDIKHHYVYPGDYILIATADGYTSGGQARMNVRAVIPDLKISKVGGGEKENFIDLFNNTDYDLFLSNFYLNLDGTFYKIPKNFMIAKNSIVHLSGESMGFKLPAYNISLHLPNKNLLIAFPNNISINTTATTSSIVVATKTINFSIGEYSSESDSLHKINLKKENVTISYPKSETLQIKKLILKSQIRVDKDSIIDLPITIKDKVEEGDKVKNVDINIVNWFKNLIY